MEGDRVCPVCEGEGELWAPPDAPGDEGYYPCTSPLCRDGFMMSDADAIAMVERLNAMLDDWHYGLVWALHFDMGIPVKDVTPSRVYKMVAGIGRPDGPATAPTSGVGTRCGYPDRDGYAKNEKTPDESVV